MTELLRLLAYARRYWASLAASVVLMAAAGGSTAMMALLIGPIFDRVLNASAANTPVKLYTDPIFHHNYSFQRQSLKKLYHEPVSNPQN